MPKKLPELSTSSSLGDIDDILHNRSVADLSWLDVDMEEYRRFEALPRQNLDSIPELTRALISDDRDPRVPQIVPLKPHTIVNTNPLETPSPPTRSSIASVNNRLAHYIMQGLDEKTIHTKLTSEFSPGTLRASSEDCKKILDERGVLGNVYVNAEHFPKCHQDKKQQAFVAKNCKKSLFVLQKSQCTNCVMNQGGRCASFSKRIVSEVPYTGQVLAHYLPDLQREKRIVSGDLKNVKLAGSSSSEERKSLLKLAFNRSPVVVREISPNTIRSMPKANFRHATWKEFNDFWRRFSSVPDAEPMPSPIYLTASRKIMTGEITAISLASSSDPEVRKLAFEHGILGKSYIDGDALGGPKKTLNFLSSMKCPPDFILFRGTYGDEVSLDSINKLSKISNVVSKRPELGKDFFISACKRALDEGRVSMDQVKLVASKVGDDSDWASLTSQMNLYVPPAQPKTVDVQSALKGSFFHGGGDHSIAASPMNYEEVRKSISHLMNTGLEGRKLVAAVTSRYTKNDVAQFPELKNSLASNDGVQGSYFIDPTAYNDFGRGCNEGSKLFRKRGAKHIMAGSSCSGCRSQTAPGWCNKYAKKIIRSVPQEVVRYASEKRRLPMVTSDTAPLRNPVEEWGLTSELVVEVSTEKPKTVDINLPSNEL